MLPKLDPILKRIGGALRERTIESIDDPLPPRMTDFLARLGNHAPVKAPETRSV
jgi:hypothetical protein